MKRKDDIKNQFFTQPPIFVGENYDLRVVKMRTYLEDQTLWEMVQKEEIIQHIY